MSFGAVESNGGPQSEMMVCTSLPHGERVTGSNSEYCKKKKSTCTWFDQGHFSVSLLVGAENRSYRR